jgi:hypothetical protein
VDSNSIASVGILSWLKNPYVFGRWVFGINVVELIDE